MPVPFGFSISDFISAVGLINGIHKAVKDTGGAKDKFEQIQGDLLQLELVLEELGGSTWGKNCDPAHVNVVRGIAPICQTPYTVFLEKIKNYRPMFNKPESEISLLYLRSRER